MSRWVLLAPIYCCCCPTDAAPIFDNTFTTVSASPEASALARFTFNAALTVRHSVERTSWLKRCIPGPVLAAAQKFAILIDLRR